MHNIYYLGLSGELLVLVVTVFSIYNSGIVGRNNVIVGNVYWFPDNLTLGSHATR